MADVKSEVPDPASAAADSPADTLQTLNCIYCRAVIAMINGTARYKQHLSELLT